VFDLEFETNDVPLSCSWVGDTFFYINVHNKLCYVAKEQSFTYCFVPRNYTILGHVSNNNRLFLVGSKNKLITYDLPMAFSDAISMISADEMNITKQITKLTNSFHDKIARF